MAGLVCGLMARLVQWLVSWLESRMGRWILSGHVKRLTTRSFMRLLRRMGTGYNGRNRRWLQTGKFRR